ncbi:hypothetical protein EMCRGX_G029893 [Ephydatia muelleri]
MSMVLGKALLCKFIEATRARKKLYTLLITKRLSHSMQFSEHRIFTAIDFHHLSVQQHKSYLSDAFTTDSRCGDEVYIVQEHFKINNRP